MTRQCVLCDDPRTTATQANNLIREGWHVARMATTDRYVMVVMELDPGDAALHARLTAAMRRECSRCGYGHPPIRNVHGKWEHARYTDADGRYYNVETCPVGWAHDVLQGDTR